MAPQKATKPKTNTPVDPYADLPDTSETPVDPYADLPDTSETGADPYAEMPSSSLDSLTTNPNKQGTYRMLSPGHTTRGSYDAGVMIPYGNVKTALQQGYALHPDTGDLRRYANDLFTELKGKGTAPSVDSEKNSDSALENTYGVVPTPAAGSKEWFERGGLKVAHGTIDSIPTAASAGGALATGIPGAATGPGDVFIAGEGAALGGAGGEALKQFLNDKIFGEKLGKKESLNRIALQGALGFGQEIGGRAIAAPLGAAARYFGFTADESAKAGIRMLPSEARGKVPTWMEEFLKGSVLSKGIMDKFREAQNKESLAAVDNLMESISTYKGTPEQLGQAVQKGLEDSEAALRAEQNALYGALDNITEKVVKPATESYVPVLKSNGKPLLRGGVPVTRRVVTPEVTRVMPSTVELKKFAQEQLDKINKPPYFLPPDALEKAREAFNTILKNPDQVSFKRMRDMRSVMLSQVRQLDELMGGGKLGLAQKFAGLTDKSIEEAADKSGIPGLTKRWREANEITAEGHRMFEQKLVDKAAESDNPEFIAQLIGGKTIGLQQTRDLFKALPEKMHDPVRRGLLQDAVTKATERNGAFDEGKFANSIYKLGDERGQIIFGKNWNNVKELSEIIGKINGPVGLGGGGGASLQNVGIMRKIASAIIAVPAAAGAAAGIGTGHTGEGLLVGTGIGLGGLATEGAAARTVAWAMANPAKAAKMLEVARIAARATPYVGGGLYNAVKPVHKLIQDSSDDLNKKAIPLGPQSSVTKPDSLGELLEKSRRMNPAAQGQTEYAQVAVNPNNGHRIGTNDGGRTWFDVQNGQPVA